MHAKFLAANTVSSKNDPDNRTLVMSLKINKWTVTYMKKALMDYDIINMLPPPLPPKNADFITEIEGNAFALALEDYYYIPRPPVAGAFINEYFNSHDDVYWAEYFLEYPEDITLIKHAVINKRRFQKIMASIIVGS